MHRKPVSGFGPSSRSSGPPHSSLRRAGQSPVGSILSNGTSSTEKSDCAYQCVPLSKPAGLGNERGAGPFPIGDAAKRDAGEQLAVDLQRGGAHGLEQQGGCFAAGGDEGGDAALSGGSGKSGDELRCPGAVDGGGIGVGLAGSH